MGNLQVKHLFWIEIGINQHISAGYMIKSRQIDY